MLLSRAMPRRTAKGRELMHRALGFAKYVKTAETQQHAFAERANIFTAYLPYAIVFKCVDKWSRAFRDIDMQAATASFYAGTHAFNPATFTSDMNDFSSSVSGVCTSKTFLVAIRWVLISSFFSLACSSIFEALGRSWRHVGPYGDGTKVKLVANLLVAVHNLATAEALTLGRKAGLDVALLYEAICDSAATSRIFEVSGRLVLDDELADGLAKVQILNKDIRIIREYAAELGAVVPLLATTSEYYTSAMARGMERMEDASVSVLIELLSGLR